MSPSEYGLTPIGSVSWSEECPQLRFEPAYIPALEGLPEFKHIIVLFWCHQTDTDPRHVPLVHDKPYARGPQRIGAFATRSPARPNPIGLTTVQLLRLDPVAGVITVPYIDAADGSPIIDIKPYHPSLDRIREVGVPDWCRHWPQWQEDSGRFDWEAEFSFS